MSAILSGLLLGCGAAPAWAWQCEAAEVLRVHDGDTLSVRCGESAAVKLRIADIDAPELHQAYGKVARADLAMRVDGQRLQVHSRAVDRYERIVATIVLNDHDIGLALVADGLAWCGMRPGRACHEAMQAARAARRGLWADAQPLPPWQWRRQHPRRD